MTTGLCAQHPGPSLTQASRQGAVPQAGGRAAEGGRAQQVEAFLAAVHDARAVHEALAGARLPVADGVVHEARVRAVDHWKRQRGTRVRDAPRRRAGGRRRTPPSRSEARRGRRPAGPPSSAPAEPAAARGHALQPGQADAAAAHAAREADAAAAAVRARPALHARAISRAEARGGVAPGDTRGPFGMCAGERGRQRREGRPASRGATCAPGWRDLPCPCPVPAERLWHERRGGEDAVQDTVQDTARPVPLPHTAWCGSSSGVPEPKPPSLSGLLWGQETPRVHGATFCAPETTLS